MPALVTPNLIDSIRSRLSKAISTFSLVIGNPTKNISALTKVLRASNITALLAPLAKDLDLQACTWQKKID
jgi:hypothetical protein